MTNPVSSKQILSEQVGGANKSFKIATRYTAYDLWRALRVLTGAAETGKAMIVPDGDALRITTYDWIKTKAAVLEIPLIEYNDVGRYYVVDVWELYEAVDKLMGHVMDPWRLYMHDWLRPSKDDMTIGIEDHAGEEVTVYVEIDVGLREQLKAHVTNSHKAKPFLKPAAGIWVYVKPLLGALTRARRTGAEYVDIAITSNGLRIKGGKYAAEIGGHVIAPGKGRMKLEGRYPMSAVYDVVSHSIEFNMIQVLMTADALLYFDYVILGSLTAYLMPAY